MNVKPVITVEAIGNNARVKFLGIDISTALTAVSYTKEAKLDSSIILEIKVNKLIDILCAITPEKIENAREILAPYKESRDGVEKLLSGEKC
nr:MAG TPA: hypothetical protein [Bacteriophage sp.]